MLRHAELSGVYIGGVTILTEPSRIDNDVHKFAKQNKLNRILGCFQTRTFKGRKHYTGTKIVSVR